MSEELKEELKDIEVEKELTDVDTTIWPGKVKFAPATSGHWAGCITEGFVDAGIAGLAEQINKYAEKFPERLIVSLQPMHRGDGTYAALAFYSVTIDRDQMDVLEKRAEIIETQVREYVAEQNKSKREDEAAKVAADIELRRLAEVGKRHEQNCSKKGKKGETTTTPVPVPDTTPGESPSTEPAPTEADPVGGPTKEEDTEPAPVEIPEVKPDA